jgi:hypothetical protein
LFGLWHGEYVPLIMRYNSPSVVCIFYIFFIFFFKDWESECLPIGNGYIGASVFEKGGRGEVILNKHTLWLLLLFFL